MHGAPTSRAGLDLLSRREHRVLELTSEGLTNTDVASALEISVHAVKFHLASIFRKLGVSNRTQAAAAFLRAQAAADRGSAEVLP
jgi:DNA-binding CsgD family transcriptional regulator